MKRVVVLYQCVHHTEHGAEKTESRAASTVTTCKFQGTAPSQVWGSIYSDYCLVVLLFVFDRFSSPRSDLTTKFCHAHSHLFPFCYLLSCFCFCSFSFWLYTLSISVVCICFEICSPFPYSDSGEYLCVVIFQVLVFLVLIMNILGFVLNF